MIGDLQRIPEDKQITNEGLRKVTEAQTKNYEQTKNKSQ